MAYSEVLAKRIRKILIPKNLQVEEKKMMGGLTFMVDEKMCVGVVRDDLMVRIAPEEYEFALQKTGCRPMDFTGRPMPGFVFVNHDGISTDQDLENWLNLALEFNPRAKKSKSARKK